MVRVGALTLIGYWAGPQTQDGWPRPQQFVDAAWDPDERDLVADYLARGHVARACMDVVDHQVRLPAQFVEHVSSRMEALENAPRDETWWAGQPVAPVSDARSHLGR